MLPVTMTYQTALQVQITQHVRYSTGYILLTASGLQNFTANTYFKLHNEDEELGKEKKKK